MPKRITKLTPKQTARFGEWARKWIDIGLSTEPADFDRATVAALACYDLAKLRRPRIVLRMGSPFAATLGGEYAAVILGGHQVRHQVRQQVEQQVRQQVRQQVEQHVRQEVRQQVEQHVRQQIEQQVEQQVRQQVWQQVWQVRQQVEQHVRQQVWQQVWQVRQQVEQHVRQQVWQQVEQQVWHQVRQQVEQHVRQQVEQQVEQQVRQVRQQVRSSWTQYRACQLWAGWYAYVSFLRDVCGWEDASLTAFAADEELALAAGWTWWHEDVVAISERPKLLTRDQGGRLHNETGPALQYPDGWSLYCWHGYLLPASHEWLIVEKDRLSLGDIEAEPNAELRRVALEIYGFDKYLGERKAKVLSKDTLHGQPRRLLSCKVGDDTIRILEVINGSEEPDGTRRKFHLGAMPGKTPHECVAASFGRPADKYREAVGT